MKRLKRWWAAACRRPFAALYGLGAVLLILTLAGNFALDQVLYAAGLLQEQTITLADTDRYTLVNLEQTGPDTLVSQTGDAQLLLETRGLVRRVRLVAAYDAAGADCERDLYYHLPGGGYTPRLRVWPRLAADGASWTYTVPRWAGQNLRLDLADTAPVTIRLQAVVLNERAAWYTYFIPSLWQLFWLAAAPGLAGCAVTLGRKKGETP